MIALSLPTLKRIMDQELADMMSRIEVLQAAKLCLEEEKTTRIQEMLRLQEAAAAAVQPQQSKSRQVNQPPGSGLHLDRDSV